MIIDLAIKVPSTVADPAPVKTSQKKMGAVRGRKFCESLGPPLDKFLDPLLV